MKLITRNTDYALRAICYLSLHKRVVTVTELVKKLGVPRPFIRKILQKLTQQKILESFKGLSGGFILNILPEKIFMLDIMRIFQGKVGINGCFLKKDICPNRSKCVLRKKIHKIEDQVIKQLESINIAALI